MALASFVYGMFGEVGYPWRCPSGLGSVMVGTVCKNPAVGNANTIVLSCCYFSRIITNQTPIFKLQINIIQYKN